MGPSGSGKTTILRAIAGLEPFHAGRIAVDGVTLEGGTAAPERRRCAQLRRKVGMVFQFHCLFEHLSAIDERLPRAGARARRRAGRTPTGARASCSARSASSIAPARCRASSRAAKRSASRSRARSRWIRRCC